MGPIPDGLRHIIRIFRLFARVHIANRLEHSDSLAGFIKIQSFLDGGQGIQ